MTKLEPGVVRIAHTRSGESGADEVVIIEFDDQGVLLSWPRALSFGDAFDLNNDEHTVPEPLVLRDGDGWLTLVDGHSLGASASTLAHSLERIRYRRAIHTGTHNIDYQSVNGMTSEIDGLAKWAKRVPVTTKLLFDEQRERLEGVSLVAKNMDSLSLGGPLDLKLDTSYLHQPAPKDGIFSISTALLVRTRSTNLMDWGMHQQAHRMMQDLMCLVYGRACASRLVSVMREDDQERPPIDERRYWRDVYEPTFGRSIKAGTQPGSASDPLFYSDEADPARIATWLSEYSYWSRPTWIAMSALFARSLPVESRLLQIAVALEALGYAIAKRQRPDNSVNGTYESLLAGIFESMGYSPEAVVGKFETAGSWCSAFNKAYKGVKHADNTFTDDHDAWLRGREGFTLIRCWLAAELGVAEDLVSKRLRDGSTAS